MGRSKSGKRKYSGLSLKEAMQMLDVVLMTPWTLQVPPRKPSDHLMEDIRRFESFDLEISEAAKLLMVDALFAEIVPHYPNLKVWKSASLETDTLLGYADYVIAPKRGYLSTPLLCVAEAKRDDFVQGRAQCLGEIAACLWNNQQEGLETDIFGIVSNGQIWQFYRRVLSGEVYESDLFTTAYLDELLGVLDFVCAECSRSLYPFSASAIMVSK